MSAGRRFRAEPIGDGARWRLSAGAWSEVIPAEQIPARLAFYRRLRDRKGGRYARFHAETVEVLEQAQDMVDKAAPPRHCYEQSGEDRPEGHVADSSLHPVGQPARRASSAQASDPDDLPLFNR